MKKSFFGSKGSSVSSKGSSVIEDAARGVKLVVKVIKAEGILAKDRGGTSDPFAEVKLGKQSKKTKVIPKTLTPEWEESFTFDLPDDPPSLDVVLYDHDKGLLGGSSEYLGSITLDGSLFTIGAKIEDWYDLTFDKRFQKKEEAVTGRVQVSVQVVGSPSVRELSGSGLEGDFSRLASGSVGSENYATMSNLKSNFTGGNISRRSSLEASEAMVLEVVVQKAEGLIAMDRGGTSDPFCEVRLGKQKQKTKVKPKTLSPHWDETFLLDYTVSMTNLSVILFDHDKGLLGSSADYLGSVEVDLSSLEKDQPVRQWYPLVYDKQYHKKKDFEVKGRILLQLTALEPAHQRSVLDTSKLPRPARDAEKAQQLKLKGIGTLEVSVLGAERLMAADRGGTSDPFVELSVGGTRAKTKTKKKTLNPSWDEPFSLEVPPGATCLEALVMDENLLGSSTFLGRVVVNLDDLEEGEDMVHTFVLQPRTQKHKAKVGGSIQLFIHLLARGNTVMQIPEVNMAEIKQRHQQSNRGACTVCVIGAMSLPLSDPSAGSYVEVHAGGTKTATRLSDGGQCPVWNAPFFVEVPGDAQVVQVIVYEKSSATISVRKGDDVLGTATLFLGDLPESLTYAWYDLIPLKATDEAQGSIKLCTAAHLIPQLALNRLRREPTRVKENASKGLGTLELLVVAAKHIPPSMDGAVRQVLVTLTAGTKKMTIEGGSEGLNPVWNKGVTIDVDPDVQTVELEVMDKAAEHGHKSIGSVGILLDDLEEGIELDQWYDIKTEQNNLKSTAGPMSLGLIRSGSLRVVSNYVQKIAYIDPAERGLNQRAIGDVEIVCIAARGIGLLGGGLFGGAGAGAGAGAGSVDDGEQEEAQATIEAGTLMRCEGQIGVSKRQTQAGKPAPNPIWNERLALKLPHPTAVLEVHVLVQKESGHVSSQPFGTAQISLGELKDEESKESWYPLMSKKASNLDGGEAEEIVVGNIQLVVTVRRNYGFNLELLGGLITCPWHCGTSFEPDEAAAHFIICPLAPDPTAQVACVHLGIGCKHKGPRFGMKDHMAVCPFEPLKGVLREYVKEIRSLRAALELQDQETQELRERIVEMERESEGREKLGESAHQKLSNTSQEDLFSPGEGAGLVDTDTAAEAMQHKIIKWMPQGCTFTLEGHTDGVMCLAHSTQHKKLLSGSLDRTIKVWDIGLHEPVCDGDLKGHRGGITSIAFGGNRLVSGSTDTTIKIWDMGTMREEAKLGGHTGLVHGLILLNEMCISASQDKSIRIWDMRQRECVTTMDTKSRGCYGMAIHELKLLSASGSKIHTWDLRKIAASTMNEQQRINFGRYDTLTGNTSGVYGHQMVGDRLYTSAVDNSVRLWDLRSLQVKSKIVGHLDFVRALATAGERLLTGSDDKTIRVWDLEFHDCARVLKGHTSYINSLLCARARLFSASMDKTVKIWE